MYSRTTRENNISAGLCGDCGKQNSTQLKTCQECTDKRRLRQRTAYNIERRRLKKQMRIDRINKGLCARCGKNPLIIHKTICKQCKVNYKNNTLYYKDKAYLAYGGYVCKCCGETIKEFLTIDHINNDGCKHRKTVKPGKAFYSWLAKNNYPTQFQILCMNCNFGKSKNGGICPHKTASLV